MQHELVKRFDLPHAIISLIRTKLFSYAGISGLALACDVAIYSFGVKLGVNHTVSAALGYIGGLILHFALSRRLVFKSQAKGREAAMEAIGFVVSGVAGLIITSGVVYAGTEVLHLGTIASKAAAVALSFFGVYLLRSRFVFKWSAA
jgi:putative flippase GtrA